MRRCSLRHTLALVCLALAAMGAVGCKNDTTTGPGDTTPKDTTVMTSFALRTFAGSTPMTYDSVMTSEAGVQYKVSTLRYYVSRFSLLDSAGNATIATLVDSAGVPLNYNIAFCDYAKPETQVIRLLARKGNYTGVVLSIGVPNTTDAGAPLNHADASSQTYPLDVDNDMYWGWNPGYVFFKIEGSAMIGGTWQTFIYHVGGDMRMMTPQLKMPFTIAAAGEQHMLQVNTNKLFVTPSGGTSPNVAGAMAERVVHGGSPADSMAVNVAKSGFITLKP